LLLPQTDYPQPAVNLICNFANPLCFVDVDLSVPAADGRLKVGRWVCEEGQILLTLLYQAVTGRLFVEGCAVNGGMCNQWDWFIGDKTNDVLPALIFIFSIEIFIFRSI
jgi:hypothetical protein